MRILIVSAMYPPIQTGTSFYTRNVARALVERGNEVTVVTLRNREAEPDAEPFPVMRLPAIHFPIKNYFKHFRIASFFPGNYRAMFALVRERRPDVILLVNHYLDIAFPALAAGRRFGIPVVTSVGTQLQSTNPRRDKLLNVLDRLICGGIVFRFSTKIISWDSQIHQYLVDVHDERVTAKSVIVPYGVNGEMAVFAQHRHDYAFKGQLLGVGAVIEQRNFIFLVKVFAKLAARFPDLKLKIIGHVYFDEAVKLAREMGLGDRVVFAGEQPHAAVLDAMKRSDLYFGITTGKYTGLGTATIESMLMGVPTVSNAPTDLFPRPIRDLETYVYTDGVSVDATAERLAGILADEEARRRAGQGGRAFVSDYLSWPNVAALMEDLFRQVGPAGQRVQA